MFLGTCVLGALTLGGLLFITVPLSAIDAFLLAKKLHAGRSVGKWEFF